jgi:hypothetical protein
MRLTLIFTCALLVASACVFQRKPIAVVTVITTDPKTGEKKTTVNTYYGRLPICTEPLTKIPCRHITVEVEK